MKKKEHEIACGNCKKVSVCSIFPAVVEAIVARTAGTSEAFAPYKIAKLCKFYEFDSERGVS